MTAHIIQCSTPDQGQHRHSAVVYHTLVPPLSAGSACHLPRTPTSLERTPQQCAPQQCVVPLQSVSTAQLLCLTPGRARTDSRRPGVLSGPDQDDAAQLASAQQPQLGWPSCFACPRMWFMRLKPSHPACRVVSWTTLTPARQRHVGAAPVRSYGRMRGAVLRPRPCGPPDRSFHALPGLYSRRRAARQ